MVGLVFVGFAQVTAHNIGTIISQVASILTIETEGRLTILSKMARTVTVTAGTVLAIKAKVNEHFTKTQETQNRMLNTNPIVAYTILND